MNYAQHITDLIGNTPLVRINNIFPSSKTLFLAKLEYFNPGQSIKDRIGIKMIENAEKNGKIKPGGCIIESTSGNTGMGLALAAIKKGYKMVVTMPDKMSLEKIDILKAMGVEVIITPTNVNAEDPRSYYSVAKSLEKKTPNSFYVNQYDNLSNRMTHFKYTGPEIWNQTNGKITHLIAGVGTGGTITGCAMFLKKKNKNIKIWGIDTYGSVYKKYHETGIFDKSEIYSYITEGIGEDIIPKNVDFSLIDHFEKVSDRDAAIMTRRLAKEEGILAGNSCGAAIAGTCQLLNNFNEEDVVVIILPDHGSRYIGKIYNDKWMKENNFI
ncbi:MAG: cystathionine beta-synthase [Flavobacteriales bacterium]|nr:cystathionine beta-synthase [Flavobacteriales bacterium]|tara:strand:- start:1244 stop:2221 length:978 start_codon:yes stop_codon:yes gene_type:complete